jgi:hypothetical protein
MWLNVVVGCAMAYRRWMGAVLTATTPAGPRNKREPTPENYRVPVYIFHINFEGYADTDSVLNFFRTMSKLEFLRARRLTQGQCPTLALARNCKANGEKHCAQLPNADRPRSGAN